MKLGAMKNLQYAALSGTSDLFPGNDRERVTTRKSRPSETFQDMGLPPTAISPDQSRPSPSRRKRPIDIAYESMRSYSEPPRRQPLSSIPMNGPYPPQPVREPPPLPPQVSYPQAPQRPPPPAPYRAQMQAPVLPLPKNHGKAKLNLLNPMSLLARRRSSQAVEEAHSQTQSTPRLPDDFDPRIRGKVIHDFSAPRPNRPVSANEGSRPTTQVEESEEVSETKQKMLSSNHRTSAKLEDDSPSSTEREHTPVFKENFDDSVQPWTSDMDSPAQRRSSAFMYQLSLQSSQVPDPSSLPAFARKLPSTISNEVDAHRKISTAPLNPALEILLESPSPYQKSAPSTPPTSPPKSRSRAASVTDLSSQIPSSLQRFKSNASRFSFDLAGVGSATQEKLLEEKHREKAKQKRRETLLSEDDDLDNESDYADYDDMDDDGLEEEIPGVNVDGDSDVPNTRHAIENSNLVSPNKSSFESAASAVSTGITSLGTPRDSQGQYATFASKSSPDLFRLQVGDSSKEGALRPKSYPDGDASPGFVTDPLAREIASETNLAGLPRRYDYQDDDDMYYDDGMIEDFNDGEQQVFDESVFDDDSSRVYGLPLRDLEPSTETRERNDCFDDPLLAVSTIQQGLKHPQSEALARSPSKLSSEDATVAEMRDSVTNLNYPIRSLSTSHTTVLTQDNLGLHDRLAYAANQAALEGKFNRSYSQGSTHESYDGPNSSLGTATQDTYVKTLNTGLPYLKDIGGLEDFAFDDAHLAFTEAEDDDPIIAAANAEALENDDDGFYGQEFGFFARKPGSSESEYVNGGYLGARALEGVHRMNSGRDNFLEPSLTPITERSEWSNRNSMVSLAKYGYPLSTQYQSNPQLADLMRVQEGEELSLEALRKLRKDAWGGSNVSLPSSTNSQNGGSPLTYLPPNMTAPFMQPSNSNGSMISPTSQTLAGSFHSFSSGGQASSNDSNPSPSGESPTVTLSVSQPNLMLYTQPMGPPPPPPQDSSPVRWSSTNPKPWVPGHSRASSGAESVSYREENGKWFCERSRKDEETGEIELLGRSVVEGGRI